MITLKMIAEEAGVSVMTVSNVINKNHARVSKETILRVNEIIKRRGYVPNLSARSLSAKKSNIIAILSVETEGSLMEDSYASQMIGSIELFLRKRGYYVMLRSYQTAEDIVELFHKWNIDGGILFYPLHFESKDMKRVLDTGIPTVVVDRYFEDLSPLTVDLNDFRGGYLPAKYLINHGHKRMAFVCPLHVPTLVVGRRLDGFRKALEEAGLGLPQELFFDTDSSIGEGKAVGREIALMENPPTAVFTTLDRLAVGVVEGLRTAGASVPADVSVIGFDDSPVLKYMTPKITTVVQNLAEKSSCIADLLIRKIQKEEIEHTHITLDVELIERQSVRNLNA